MEHNLKKISFFVFLSTFLIGCGGGGGGSGNGSGSGPTSAAALYSGMCGSCHGATGDGGSSNVVLSNFTDVFSLQAQIDQNMPKGSPSDCVDVCAQKIAEFIVGGFSVTKNAGTVTLHRLNRAEYNNTVRDLLLTQQTPANEFPSDDFGYGFDNMANVLSLSPLHVELLENSATQLAEEAALRPILQPTVVMVEAETLVGTSGAASAGAWDLNTNGSIGSLFQIPIAGVYEFTARVWGTQAGTELVNMDLRLDGLVVQNVDVPNLQNNPALFKITTNLPVGSVEFSVAFLNDFFDTVTFEDRNLLVDWLQVEGPFNVTLPDRPYRAKLYSCDPATIGEFPCAHEIITAFASQAWRRPVSSVEVEDLVVLFGWALNQGDDFDTGISLAMRGVLLSPHFIFRVETDPTNTSNSHPLSAHELATRLSYFLWSSTPDDVLMALADSGQLLQSNIIAQQVARMLSDPKAQALVDNFAGQWLHIRALLNVTPDYNYYPSWDEELRASLQAETAAFFSYLINTNVNMQELLNADYSFINTRLASHYSMAAPISEFAKTNLPTNRSGYLTQGGFLTATSYPTRTSIVKRGQWVLGNLLCSEPPPPPPGVEGLPTTGTPTGSLREIMETHRTDPMCASCHDAMDPIGFSLEHYDAIGKWRDLDNGFVIDDSGQLPDGTTFSGADGLAQVVINDPRYSACIVRKLYTYALGRGPQLTDTVYLGEINSAWVNTGMGFRELATLIAQSDPFITRRSEATQ